jgi:iterative type I PKS product template protein
MYADVALTIAHHIQQQPQSGFPSSGHNITAMEVHHPLIINPSRDEETRVLRIYARPDPQTQTIKVEYVSVLPAQKAETKHATCVIEFGDAEKWLRRWSHDLYLIQDRIADLKKLADVGEVSKITSRLAYRLFSSLVDYAPQYQRMDQVLLSSDVFEATATIKLDDRGDDATFFCSPYWIDALLHLSGFIMNGNDALDYNEAVYISHGWEGMCFAKPLNPKGNYQVYVRMLPRDKTMVGGKVWILCDGVVVGLAEDLRFQRVPRTVLNMLLPPVDFKNAPERKVLKAVPVDRAPRTPITERQSVATPSKQDAFLDTIAAELGLSPSEVSPDDLLHDLGVDSLMSLTLASKLIEQFAISISHSELMDCPKVTDLLNLLQQKTGGVVRELTSNISHSASDNGSLYRPPSSSDSFVAVESFTPNTPGGDTAELVRSIILEETGIPLEDLELDADLSTVGVDSLVSLAVLARLREAGIELSMTFFQENRTMSEVFRALAESLDVATPASKITERTDNERQDEQAPSHQARLILLQRRSSPTSTSSLFLFPDGSGSPFAYAMLEQINPDFDVYGLVCPFINSPEDYTGGIEASVRVYLTAIREQQPQGPYHFGGWSVGGVLAYEASRQLIEADHKVQSLTLIDAPCPVTLSPMPSSLIEHLASKGVFDQLKGGSVPKDEKKRESLLKHFDATVRNLGLYKPSSIVSASSAPETLIVWAKEGVDGAPSASHPVSATESWILRDRSDFGPHGWDSVLPAQKISTISVPGNHFSMMSGQNVSVYCNRSQKLALTSNR